VQDDEFSNLRNSLRRSPALRAPDHSGPRIVETFPHAAAGYSQPARVGLTFWQWCARVVPIVAALASTSLLAFYVLFDHRLQPVGWGHPQDQPRSERSSDPEAGSEIQSQSGPSTSQRQVQAQTTSPTQQQTQSPPVQAPQQQPIPADLGPRLPMPSDDVLVMLIMSSVTALNQANATGNYSVLHDMAAPAFQNANSVERLAQIFSELRNRHLDLGPVLLFQPKLFLKPEMNGQGLIRIVGFFPTSPERVNFDLIFQPVQSRWRLFGIAVNTSPAAPTKQTESAPAADEPKAAAEDKSGPEKKTETEPAKPATSTKKVKPKAEVNAATEKSSNSDVDVRDRIDRAPPPSSQAPKKPKNIWNPFSR
jgi:hypothetical protein